jgi:ankyrin repeat protein
MIRQSLPMVFRALHRCCVLLLVLVAALPAGAGQGAIGQNELPVHDVARMGTREQMEKLLRDDPPMRDARTELGSTPLHYAALNADSGPLKALLAAGAKAGAVDKEGQTPLHLAAFATRIDNVRALLAAGADPYAKSNAGRDAFSMARRARADEVVGIMSIWVLKGCKPEKPC